MNFFDKWGKPQEPRSWELGKIIDFLEECRKAEPKPKLENFDNYENEKFAKYFAITRLENNINEIIDFILKGKITA